MPRPLPQGAGTMPCCFSRTGRRQRRVAARKGSSGLSAATRFHCAVAAEGRRGWITAFRKCQRMASGQFSAAAPPAARRCRVRSRARKGPQARGEKGRQKPAVQEMFWCRRGFCMPVVFRNGSEARGMTTVRDGFARIRVFGRAIFRIGRNRNLRPGWFFRVWLPGSLASDSAGRTGGLTECSAMGGSLYREAVIWARTNRS